MALTDDILAKIRRDFSGGEMLPVIDRLEGLQREDSELFCDRILRCIVFVAAGRQPIIEQAIEQARTDYRDLIVWAEYDGHFGAQHRDLSLPFAA
jgi:hypothetical protein